MKVQWVKMSTYSKSAARLRKEWTQTPDWWIGTRPESKQCRRDWWELKIRWRMWPKGSRTWRYLTNFLRSWVCKLERLKVWKPPSRREQSLWQGCPFRTLYWSWHSYFHSTCTCTTRTSQSSPLCSFPPYHRAKAEGRRRCLWWRNRLWIRTITQRWLVSFWCSSDDLFERDLKLPECPFYGQLILILKFSWI